MAIDIKKAFKDIGYSDDVILMDGFDDCVIGVCQRHGQEDIAAYDLERVIDKLVEMGMDDAEAREFWEYNQIGSWVGEKTPCYITLFEEET